MQVAQLTQTALDVCHMDLNVILKATGSKEKRTIRTFKAAAGILSTDLYLPEVGGIDRCLNVI